ncbi:bZIP transcription factor TGA10 [Linum perenne]
MEQQQQQNYNQTLVMEQQQSYNQVDQDHQHHQQQQMEEEEEHHHHHQQQQRQLPYGMMMNQSSSSPSSSSPNFMSKEGGAGGGAYDLGELDQALLLYLDGGHNHNHNQLEQQQQQQQQPFHHHQQQQQQQHGNHQASGGMNSSSSNRPPTLNIFPSHPMHAATNSGAASHQHHQGLLLSSTTTTTTNSNTSGSKRPPNSLPGGGDSSSVMDLSRHPSAAPPPPLPPAVKSIKREGNRKGPTASNSEHEGPKTPDPKTLRRLAQNREAARKSRLRKKAYVQQLESSRIKLTQLEQELQRARAQVSLISTSPFNTSSNLLIYAAVFDMEYGRWLEEHHRLTCELRAAVQEHLPENELRLYVDNCLAHYDVVMNLKGMVAKADVFHLVSGMWKTPAERCFMWMGGFRPSELIKIIVSQIEPLTEQQILGICGLQQSTQEAEEALSQGLDALNQSLSDTIASDSLSCPPNMANYMGQMAMAINKLSTMEGFVRQADNLRHQTLHRLHQILTTRQAARCFLAIAEYFHRLRALSSLWLARPRQD